MQHTPALSWSHKGGGDPAGGGVWRPGAGPARLVRVCGVCCSCAVHQPRRQGRGAPAHVKQHCLLCLTACTCVMQLMLVMHAYSTRSHRLRSLWAISKTWFYEECGAVYGMS